ncbi:excisionase [Pantoea dispersa]|uniref:excisionase n=1 Tax=Pantoea TaxID=53335 RepID=UPI000F5FD7F1|nr:MULTISPECIES: excisionase [Pantoea]AZI52021.1 excisionase [Pantoea agglomerans]MCT6589223.1 excisionase [Pantoea dispersa]UBN55269.1 excisionase [Pantoea agglomerans]HDG5313254.1 excisionase [Klebsiella pneumoniae]
MSLDVMPISTYCQTTGESVDAINKRIQRKIWQVGVHVLKVDGVQERWIDLEEVNRWARKSRDPLYRGA